MRVNEFLSEGKSMPVIVVDVQPEYANYGNNAAVCHNIVTFVVNQTGPVLFFANAENTGVSGDTIYDIKRYWEDEVYEYSGEYDDPYQDPNFKEPIDWSRFTLVDKGYGYLRSWHDQGVDDTVIVKAIRLMYQAKVNDSRQLFGGEDSDTYEQGMRDLLGDDYLIGMGDTISVGWASVAQLKKFNGAYLVGGGRNECLWEVKVLMNAFNIRYKMIDSLVYG